MQLEILGDGIRLKRVCDCECLAAHQAIEETLPDLIKWFAWCHASYSREDVAAWQRLALQEWENRTGFHFYVLPLTGETILGCVGLNMLDWVNRRANLGYWVRATHRGRGIALRSASAAIDYGFEELKLHRIEIVTDVENHRSQRVAEKLHAVKEGVLRDRLWIKDQCHSAFGYSVLPQDWRSRRESQRRA